MAVAFPCVSSQPYYYACACCALLFLSDTDFAFCDSSLRLFLQGNTFFLCMLRLSPLSKLLVELLWRADVEARRADCNKNGYIRFGPS